MLKQLEGSHAVAEAVALCRPEVICAYPISPQTHIVEGARRAGRRGRGRTLRVHQRRIRIRRDVGGDRRLGRRRARLHRHRLAGLLFMAEALFNASGLGLPIVMTVANRAIGAPINIWNDHTDSMSQRDCGWIQLFAETNQEALDLHIQAFRLAEELSLPVMVCMDGFILTHAYERVDMPDAEAGGRLSAAVRAEAGARSERAGLHRRDGRARSLHRGALPRAREADGGARADPELGGRVPPRVRPRSGRPGAAYRIEDAETVVVALGSVLGTVKDTVDEMRAAVRIGALGHRLLPALAARRGARGARRREARHRAGEEPRRRHRRHRLDQRAHRARSRDPGPHRDRGPGRPPDHASFAADGSSAPTKRWSRPPSSTSTARWWRRCSRGERAAPQRAARRTSSCGKSMAFQPVKYYQTGTFTVGNRLLPAETRSVQANMRRTNSLNSGHRACQGCGEALGARYAIDAAMEATQRTSSSRPTRPAASRCSPRRIPETSWQIPWIHSLFGNAAAVATGIAAAMKAKNKQRRPRHRPGRRRRHHRHRLRLPVGHVRAQRRRALHLLRQRGLHEHRRAALLRHAARGAHRDHHRAGNSFGQGKNIPLIAMAHGIPYVATATIAELRDLEAKVKRAMEIRGARYIHIFVSCPLGWGPRFRRLDPASRAWRRRRAFSRCSRPSTAR